MQSIIVRDHHSLRTKLRRCRLDVGERAGSQGRYIELRWTLELANRETHLEELHFRMGPLRGFPRLAIGVVAHSQINSISRFESFALRWISV